MLSTILSAGFLGRRAPLPWVALLPLLALLTPAHAAEPAAPATPGTHALPRVVVDAATGAIQIRRGSKLVRLLGVEAIRGGEEDARPAAEITTFVAGLVEDGRLRFEYDPAAPEESRRDAAYVFLSDGGLLNEIVLRSGYARASLAPHPRRARFVLLEAEAATQRAGLWREITILQGQPASETPEGGGAAASSVAYRVYYATARAATGSRAVNDFYGAEEADAPAYGSCVVGVPRDRPRERPLVWTLDVHVDPARKPVLLSIETASRDRFYDDLAHGVALSKEKEALVFVHGYDVTFAEAVRRTAQVAYDLGFDGAPIAYAWPSAGTIEGYLADSAAAVRTAPRLRAFLEEVAARSGASVVHVIAHSLGARALSEALLPPAVTAVGAAPMRFGQIVLAAPDIDAAEFRERLAPGLVPMARRVTLYASSRDEILKMSRRIHGSARAGEAGEGIVVADGIDTIDATAADESLSGHGYYRQSAAVAADLDALLRTDAPPDRRAGMRRERAWGRLYWILSPAAAAGTGP